MYQAWIQFKDPTKSVDIDVSFPSREDGEEKEKEEEDKSEVFTVPYWDNVICTLRYSEEYYGNGKLRSGSGDSLLDPEADPDKPLEDLILEQTCGFQLLSMYDTGDYLKVGKGQDEAKGNDSCKSWEGIDQSRSGFLDGGRVGALCSFKRPFNSLCAEGQSETEGTCPGGQAQLEHGQTLDLIAGFNIYHSDTSDYRYAYGWSPDSYFRKLSWRLGATSSVVGLATAALAVLVTF